MNSPSLTVFDMDMLMAVSACVTWNFVSSST